MIDIYTFKILSNVSLLKLQKECIITKHNMSLSHVWILISRIDLVGLMKTACIVVDQSETSQEPEELAHEDMTRYW